MGVQITAVFNIDLSKIVSEENKARRYSGKAPMSPEETREFALRAMAYRFEAPMGRKDSTHRFEVEVTSDTSRNVHPFQPILPILRQRIHLEPDDKARDEELADYSSMEALRECCAHHVGCADWADYFLQTAKNCQFVVAPKIED